MVSTSYPPTEEGKRGETSEARPGVWWRSPQESLLTIALVTSPHVEMDVAAKRVPSCVQGREPPEERPGILCKRVEAEEIHHLAKNLGAWLAVTSGVIRGRGRRGKGDGVSHENCKDGHGAQERRAYNSAESHRTAVVKKVILRAAKVSRYSV